METNELALKVCNVKKKYRLGVIGGGTLQGDIVSWWARIRGKEDPNAKIGEESNSRNGTFMALKGISFEVKKGERLGIIGGNGAGKSTILKILSRVTAPTEGEIYINGRISSMLEVGTGFHPELTGRENIYLNGAILGMSKEEVDKKIENIIDFSECSQFIDTPVKRYSSGMYVKLAFAVAAHLDSEILIMDEVLAVGDMKFQQKCLKKMREVADNEGKTVLYVSHNMNTIRQLCNRCIVLNKGTIVYEGDVEEAISIYMGTNVKGCNQISVTSAMRDPQYPNPKVKIKYIDFKVENGEIVIGQDLCFGIKIENVGNVSQDIYLRVIIKSSDGMAVSMEPTEEKITILSKASLDKRYTLNVSNLVPGKYTLTFVLYEIGEYGADLNIEVLRDIYTFAIKNKIGFNHNVPWNSQWWGHITNGFLKENSIQDEYGE